MGTKEKKIHEMRGAGEILDWFCNARSTEEFVIRFIAWISLDKMTVKIAIDNLRFGSDYFNTTANESKVKLLLTRLNWLEENIKRCTE